MLLVFHTFCFNCRFYGILKNQFIRLKVRNKQVIVACTSHSSALYGYLVYILTHQCKLINKIYTLLMLYILPMERVITHKIIYILGVQKTPQKPWTGVIQRTTEFYNLLSIYVHFCTFLLKIFSSKVVVSINQLIYSKAIKKIIIQFLSIIAKLARPFRIFIEIMQ